MTQTPQAGQAKNTPVVTSIDELTVDQILMAIPKINERLSTYRLKVVLEDKEEVQPAKQA